MIGCSSGKMKFEGFDNEIFAFGMGIKQSLTVDPLYQIFPENELEVVNKKFTLTLSLQPGVNHIKIKILKNYRKIDFFEIS